MTPPARGLVAEDHARFQGAYSWLSRYLEMKVDNLKTLLAPPNNSVAVQLDDLVLGYRPAQVLWKERLPSKPGWPRKSACRMPFRRKSGPCTSSSGKPMKRATSPG